MSKIIWFLIGCQPFLFPKFALKMIPILSLHMLLLLWFWLWTSSTILIRAIFICRYSYSCSWCERHLNSALSNWEPHASAHYLSEVHHQSRFQIRVTVHGLQEHVVDLFVQVPQFAELDVPLFKCLLCGLLGWANVFFELWTLREGWEAKTFVRNSLKNKVVKSTLITRH